MELGYPTVKTRDLSCIHLVRIPAYDRQTERQTMVA